MVIVMGAVIYGLCQYNQAPCVDILVFHHLCNTSEYLNICTSFCRK